MEARSTQDVNPSFGFPDTVNPTGTVQKSKKPHSKILKVKVLWIVLVNGNLVFFFFELGWGPGVPLHVGHGRVWTPAQNTAGWWLGSLFWWNGDSRQGRAEGMLLDVDVFFFGSMLFLKGDAVRRYNYFTSEIISRDLFNIHGHFRTYRCNASNPIKGDRCR